MDTPVIDVRENQQIADELREAATLLEVQGANPFRAGAYRKAADTIARLARPVRETFDAKGVAGLDALPHIGKGIAAAIAEVLITGRWNQLERLRGTLDQVKLFRRVPGVGPQLAQRMHETLHVDTLEALEAAAHDGRLESMAGVGHGARRHGARRSATPCIPHTGERSRHSYLNRSAFLGTLPREPDAQINAYGASKIRGAASAPDP